MTFYACNNCIFNLYIDINIKSISPVHDQTHENTELVTVKRQSTVQDVVALVQTPGTGTIQDIDKGDTGGQFVVDQPHQTVVPLVQVVVHDPNRCDSTIYYTS